MLFVSFFPQLIAGPIVRHDEMIPQFAAGHSGRLRPERFAQGLSIFVIGVAKKVLIADQIASYATPMFEAAAAGVTIPFLEAWGGALAYTFRIYFDFSAYSDMAVGLGLIMGVRLPINFNSPYKAASPIDFWRRWHMTLSRFLRDYLYIPLGGNRKGPARRYLNLITVMLLGGFWHGAGWTFVVWGGLHGVGLPVNHAWHRLCGDSRRPRPAAYRALCVIATFGFVVVTWVVFRAEDMASAPQYPGRHGGPERGRVADDLPRLSGSARTRFPGLGRAFRVRPSLSRAEPGHVDRRTSGSGMDLPEHLGLGRLSAAGRGSGRGASASRPRPRLATHDPVVAWPLPDRARLLGIYVAGR